MSNEVLEKLVKVLSLKVKKDNNLHDQYEQLLKFAHEQISDMQAEIILLKSNHDALLESYLNFLDTIHPEISDEHRNAIIKVVDKKTKEYHEKVSEDRKQFFLLLEALRILREQDDTAQP